MDWMVLSPEEWTAVRLSLRVAIVATLFGLPFGVATVDSWLPGGLPCGALHDIAGGGNGAIDGAAAALFTAGIAARTRGKVLWCLTRPDLFAPALSKAGLKSDRVIYLEGGDEKTVFACFEEGLRHGGEFLAAAIKRMSRATP